MKKLLLFLLVIAIQVGILFPPISPAKASQCCKIQCNHKAKPTPDSCPMHQKADCKERDPMDCCRSHCLLIGKIEVIPLKEKAISSINEIIKFQPVYINIPSISHDFIIAQEKRSLSPPYFEVSSLFIQNCSFLI